MKLLRAVCVQRDSGRLERLVDGARFIAGSIAGASIAALLAIAPAIGAPDVRPVRKAPAAARSVAGTFTPSAADPRMAALFARSGLALDTSGFRFTPSQSRNGNRAITVAVRASSNQAPRDSRALAANSGVVGLAPIAYNLGAAVGWKRFALSGDVTKVDLAGAPGSREAADVALSYVTPKWTGQVKASADRAMPGSNMLTNDPASVAIDVGGSYSLTRHLDLTAGMRYKSERERLTRVNDDRQDSQAVYVGTKFSF